MFTACMIVVGAGVIAVIAPNFKYIRKRGIDNNAPVV